MTIEDDLLNWGVIQPHDKRHFTREVRDKLARLSNYHCERCGDQVAVDAKDFIKQMHAGHAIAWSRDGSNSWDNLVCLCAKCNREQGVKSFEQAFGVLPAFRINARILMNSMLHPFY